MGAEVEGFPTVVQPTEADGFQFMFRSRKRSKTEYANERRQGTGRENDGKKLKKGPKERREAEEKAKVRPGSYPALGLNSEICRALQGAGYGFPTPIQRKVIPRVLAGDDVVAMARTGSGKTAAFLAPLLHRLAASPPLISTSSRQNGPRALVVAPTRELVLQTLKFCRLYSKLLEQIPRTAIVVGGTPLEAQFEALAVCPDIIFATPGRLLQILAEMGAKGGLTLATAETVVFDEADRLFEGTLAVETAALIANLRNKQTETIHDRQTILISATMPHALAEFSKTGLRKSLSVVRLDADKGISPTLAVAFLSTRGDIEKDASLLVLIRRITEEERTAVIFAGTHRRVEYLTDLLRRCTNDQVGCVHGHLDQMARQDAVAKFRKKVTKVLVVTDVAARGIDLPDLDAVVNYDVPATPKLFVHRVGRVGRAGRFGLALNLVAADEVPYMLDIFLFVGRGVSFCEKSTEEEFSQNVFSSHGFAMESTFQIGVLPKSAIEEEVELTRHAIEHVDLSKAYRSAKNAHGLYTKTRGVASGESVRRGKEMFLNCNGGRRVVYVHPWFASMENRAERDAAEEAAQLSTWRPKDCMVTAPDALLRRKRVRSESDPSTENVSGSQALPTAQPNDSSKAPIGISDSLANTFPSKIVNQPAVKRSSRVAAMEEERSRFFLPSRQDTSRIQSKKALKVHTGGAMGDGLNAFRELNDAAMDMTADINGDLLRAKHTGASTAKYWDRVSKKFVKGGVTSETSKRNLHVATREAKARAKAGDSYGTEDGVLFKTWLKKNRKAVEQLAERVDDGTASNLSHLGLGAGLGSNDFRKGAFGRRTRIAAAARNKDSMASDQRGKAVARSELKSTEQIKKSRKMQAKAEARRKAHGKKRARGTSSSGPRGTSGMTRGSSKSRVIVRRK